MAAFRNHFSRTRKKKTGFPKFKSAKHSRRAYTTNNQKGTVALSGRTISLPKIGMVKAVIHRRPDVSWKLKSAIVSQASDGKYYVSVLFEFDDVVNKYVADTSNAIGLDHASDGLYVDNNGEIGSNHRYYRESQKKLAREQRRLSRRKGSKKNEEKSKNYLKQEKKVNIIP